MRDDEFRKLERDAKHDPEARRRLRAEYARSGAEIPRHLVEVGDEVLVHEDFYNGLGVSRQAWSTVQPFRGRVNGKLDTRDADSCWCVIPLELLTMRYGTRLGIGIPVARLMDSMVLLVPA